MAMAASASASAATPRQIFSARDLAQALSDCFDTWQLMPEAAMRGLPTSTFIRQWGRANIVKEWQFPFHLLATHEYQPERIQWIEENK
jgi:hypothetical protein